MNPFEPYLSTYRDAHVVPERPWWRCAESWGVKWLRTDGAQAAVWSYRTSSEPTRTEILERVDAYDDAHPRPVPPMLVGQVWVGPNGDAMIIDFYTPEYPVMGLNLLPHTEPAWGLSVDKYVRGRCVLRSETEMRAMLDGAVLVSGPHAPWAPKGWRP